MCVSRSASLTPALLDFSLYVVPIKQRDTARNDLLPEFPELLG
jgi:hypothetical protein